MSHYTTQPLIMRADNTQATVFDFEQWLCAKWEERKNELVDAVLFDSQATTEERQSGADVMEEERVYYGNCPVIPTHDPLQVWRAVFCDAERTEPMPSAIDSCYSFELGDITPAQGVQVLAGFLGERNPYDAYSTDDIEPVFWLNRQPRLIELGWVAANHLPDPLTVNVLIDRDHPGCDTGLLVPLGKRAHPLLEVSDFVYSETVYRTVLELAGRHLADYLESLAA